MLELNNETKPLKIDGKEYNLSKPKNRDAEMLFKMSKAGEEKSFSASVKFLISCGLPKETAESLDIELTAQIIEYLMPVKKN